MHTININLIKYVLGFHPKKRICISLNPVLDKIILASSECCCGIQNRNKYIEMALIEKLISDLTRVKVVGDKQENVDLELLSNTILDSNIEVEIPKPYKPRRKSCKKYFRYY